MALHPDFPQSPYEILDPAVRWFPADGALREKAMNTLLPPLVAEIRKNVKAWRDTGYAGATDGADFHGPLDLTGRCPVLMRSARWASDDDLTEFTGRWISQGDALC